MKKNILPIENLVKFWGALVDLAMEMDALSKNRTRQSEVRICDEGEVRLIYDEVVNGAHACIGAAMRGTLARPELVVRHRLAELPHRIAWMYAVLLPLAVVFMSVAIPPDLGGIAPWIVRGVVLFLAACPLLYYRRHRAEIIEDCHYRRDGQGCSRIDIDLSSKSQMYACLAGEYARHLFHEYHGDGYPAWVREGWVRLVQWNTVRICSRNNNDSSLKKIVLEGIARELKCAVVLVSAAIGVRPPKLLRRIHQGYSTTSLSGFITGKPLADMPGFMERSFGTACFFLSARSREESKILEDPGSIAAAFSRE